MADQDDVRRIARSLPGVLESETGFAFSVAIKGKAKGFIWVWQERIHPKKARVPQPRVLAARVADQTDKAALLAADPDKFFTEPHYNGFPAVLVRLPEISVVELRQVITEAWRCMAPAPLVAAYDAGSSPAAPEPPPAGTRTAKPRSGMQTAKPGTQTAKPATPTAKPGTRTAKPRAGKPSAPPRPKGTPARKRR